MKKHIFLLLLFMAGYFFKAQIPNSSFENLNNDGSIKNWGAMILLAIPLDTSGNAMDSLKLDRNFYFSSNDAHSGTKALEMRNAYWKVSGEKIAGRARVSANDSDYTAFTSPLSISSNPLLFSFFYKFFPVQSDTAFAKLQLSDSLGNIVGEAEIEITGLHSTYTLASTPIIYSGTTTAVFVSIDFITAKANTEPNYGTRFLVDALSLTGSLTNLTSLYSDEKRISCFPNPAEKEITLKLNSIYDKNDLNIQVVDASGKKIKTLSPVYTEKDLKINTEELLPGLYFINVISGSYSYTTKFVK